nr:hypothetical protein Q903MT_gene33 [Picea sitchensis]
MRRKLAKVGMLRVMLVDASDAYFALGWICLCSRSTSSATGYATVG